MGQPWDFEVECRWDDRRLVKVAQYGGCCVVEMLSAQPQSQISGGVGAKLDALYLRLQQPTFFYLDCHKPSTPHYCGLPHTSWRAMI